MKSSAGGPAKAGLTKATKHILLALAVAIPLGVLGAIAAHSAVAGWHVRPSTPLTGASADTH